MTVRPYRSSDEPVLKAAYLRRGFEGGWRPMGDAVSAFVTVDDHDRPVALVAAHRMAEVRAAVDTEWETPAWRQEALTMAHDAVLSELTTQGYTRCGAMLEGAVGKAFGRRLKKVRGWFVSRGIAMEKEV